MRKNNAGLAFYVYLKTTFLVNNFIRPTAPVLLLNCSELFLALLSVLF